ncbi:hybrid sensor histidine kinase/response regulator [Phenylobacterium hankyongense]|uniref:Sensory/regulatory protein RpfC n=1 Tax=Phenylobacterium hankyongense TaxID=1813876 RepID=A0A328B2P7_9CAUL|nr:hybrid sensor histidine kinase/response regulator [Phenylobacterium hankyongense]
MALAGAAEAPVIQSRFRLRVIARLAAAVLVCVAAAPIAPWPMIAAWLAAVLLSSWCEERFFSRYGFEADGARPGISLVAPLFRCVSTALYAVMAAGLIVAGQAAQREFAFAMLTVSMVDVLMRYFRSSAVFMACITPHILVLTWIGFGLTRAAILQGEVATALTPYATAALFVVLFWAAHRQLNETWTALTLATADAHRRERAADAASRAKSQFLACMSHELRTPLNGVLGMAQAMAGGELAADQRERLKTIRRSGESLLSVLDDLLDLSKVEADRLEPMRTEFDLPHLVRGVAMAFEHPARQKGLAFHHEIAPAAEGLCLGDAPRLRRVLQALVSNAVKFTDQGEVRLSVERLDDDVCFRVSDTGVGIYADQIPHLFETFFQADGSSTRRFEGAGLGLAICHRLLRLMGGAVEVASTPGLGSTFTVRLPMPAAGGSASSERPETGPPAAQPAFGHVRVLAAEDNLVNQLVLQSLLDQVGITLTIVPNGREAIEAWETGAWDLVLMDVQMPEMNGVTATREIRSREAARGHDRTPIVALTANTMTHQIAEYEAAGMDCVIPKPLRASELFDTIARVLAPPPNAGSNAIIGASAREAAR